tara:strand:+ start:3067 stop:8067 length:5001 start_codon:yes stop_codon:yes gene_type:complete
MTYEDKKKERIRLENAGFTEEEIDKYFGERNVDLTNRKLSEQTQGNLEAISGINWASIRKSAVGDDFEGYKHFVDRGLGKGTVNLMLQQHSKGKYGLDYKKAYQEENDTGWLEEYLEGMGTLLYDLPIFIGAQYAAQGNVIGGAALGGFINDTLKNAYYEALEKGDVDSFGEYAQLYMKAGLEHGIQGGLTLAGGIGAPALIRKIGLKTGASILGRQLKNVEKNRLSKYAAVYTGLLASGVAVNFGELPTKSDMLQLALITATFGFADKSISQISRKANKESKSFQEMFDEALTDPKKMEDLANRNSKHFEGDLEAKRNEIKENNENIKKLEKEINKEGEAIPELLKRKQDANEKQFDADTKKVINEEKAAKIDLLKQANKQLEYDLKTDGVINEKRLEFEKNKIDIETIIEQMNRETVGQPVLTKYNKILQKIKKLTKEINTLKRLKGNNLKKIDGTKAGKNFESLRNQIKKAKLELQDLQIELNSAPEAVKRYQVKETKLKELEKRQQKLEIELPETNLPLTLDQIRQNKIDQAENVSALDKAIEASEGPKVSRTEAFKETLIEWKDLVTSGSFYDRLTKKWLDRINPIKELTKDFETFVNRFATNPESFIKKGALNIYERFRLQPGMIGRGLHFIEHGQLNFGLDIIGKSFKQIMKHINTPYKYEQFSAYSKAKRVLELWGRGDKDAAAIFETIGGEKGITIARRIVENGNRVYGSQFIKTFNEIRTFQTNVLKYLKDSELISASDLKRILEANQDYVPFHRMLEIDIFKKDLSGKDQMALVANPMKRITGSKAPVFDPIESIYKNTLYQIVLAEKNVAYRQLVESLEFAQKIGKESIYGPKIEFKPELGKRSLEEIKLEIKELEKLETEGSKTQRKEAKDALTRKKIEIEIERYRGQNTKTALDKIAKIKIEIKELKEQIVYEKNSELVPRLKNKLEDLELEIKELEKQNTKVAKNKIKELQEKLDILPKRQTLELKEFYEAQKKYGISQDVFTIFRPNHQILGNGEILVYRKGKAQKWYLGEEIAEAASVIDRGNVNTIVKFLGTPTRTLRVGATLDPEFMLRNLSRDTLSATIFSRNDFIPIIDTFRGLAILIKGNRGNVKAEALIREFAKSGAMQSVFQAQDKNYFKQEIKGKLVDRTFKELIKEIKPNNVVDNPVSLQNVWTTIKSGPGKGFEALRDFGAMFETASRIRDFELTMKDTKFKNLSQREKLERAGYEARDVALDFARMGIEIANVNAMSAFFNARLQGFYKLYETFANPKTRMRAFKRAAGFITLPSVLTWIGNHDMSYDDNNDFQFTMKQEYLDLPQWQKDMFWVLITGEGEDKTIWRFPKPFELGMIFGTSVEHLLTWLVDKDSKMMKNFVLDQANVHLSGISPLPDLVKIFTNQTQNYDFFRKGKMIPAKLEGVNNYQQWNANTSQFAKAFGKFMYQIHGNAMWFSSPIRIDALAANLGGGLAKKLISIIDVGIFEAVDGAREAQEEAIENNEDPDDATWFGINTKFILDTVDPPPQKTWSDMWNDLSTAPLLRVFFAKNPTLSASNQNIAEFYKIIEPFEKIHKTFGFVKKNLGAGMDREWENFITSEEYLTLGSQAKVFLLRMRLMSLSWNALYVANINKNDSYAVRLQNVENAAQDLIYQAKIGLEDYKTFKEEIDEELKLLND